MSGTRSISLPTHRHPRSSRTGWCTGALGRRVLAYLLYLLWLFDFARVFTGLPRLWVIVRLMVDWTSSPSGIMRNFGAPWLETVAMAYLGTMLAADVRGAAGIPGRAQHHSAARCSAFCTRRLFDGCRGLDQFIWALVFVRAMGLGPIAGILAIAWPRPACWPSCSPRRSRISTASRSRASPRSAPAGCAVLRYGVLPQVLPVLISQALYSIEFELPRGHDPGPCGAGGIGLRLSERIQINAWDQVAYVIVLILITVAAIDTVSRYLRRWGRSCRTPTASTSSGSRSRRGCPAR